MNVSKVLIVVAISLVAVCGILIFDVDCSDAADGQITKDGCIFEYDVNSTADDPAAIVKWDGVSSTVTIPSSITLKVPGENVGEPDIEKICKVVLVSGASGTAGCFSNNSVITKVTFMDVDSNGKTITLSSEAFANDSALTEVSIGNSISSISPKCFQKTGLVSVTIPSTVKTIGTYAFESCKSITAVELNEGLVSIEDKAFYRSPSIQKVVIPNTVTDIGNSAFGTNSRTPTKLSDVTLGNSVSKIAYGAFRNCSFTKVNIPASLKELPGITTSDNDSTRYWPSTLAFIDIDPMHEKYMTADDGSIVTKDGKTLVFIPLGMTGSFVVPDSIEIMGLGENGRPVVDNNLTSFILNDKITKVPASFLSKCKKLEYADLSSLDVLPNFICDRCTNLKTVVLSDTLESIGRSAFSNIQNLEYLEFGNDVQLGDGALCLSQVDTLILGDECALPTEFLAYGSVNYIKFPVSGVMGDSAFLEVKFNGVTELSESTLYGYIWAAGESGTLYKISNFSDPAADASVVYQIPESISIPVDLTLTASLEIADGMTVSGTIVSTNNMVTFDKFGSVGSSAILSVNNGLLEIDATDPVGLIVSEVSRVKDIGINGFTDNGASVVVDLNAYTQGIPDGLMLVQYSVYTEVDGEQFLNPFKVAAVDVEGDSTVIADVGERMLSCAVSYCYDFAGKEYWTPVSETAVMMPAEFVQMVAPLGVSMTIGNDVIENGEFLAFGTYSVKFTVPEGTQYELNGKPISDIENFVYYGQDLVFTPAPAKV